MRWIKREEITSGDTYELAYAHTGSEQHWEGSSLYVPDEADGIGELAPWLDEVFPGFAYYGLQRVTLPEWERVKEAFLRSREKNPSLSGFFAAVDEWLCSGNRGAGYFWIRGI